MSEADRHEGPSNSPFRYRRDTVSEPDPKVYRFGDMHRTGMLWWINRVALHPRGMALALHYPDDADSDAIRRGEIDPEGWSLIGDGREVFSFGVEADDESFERFSRFVVDAAAENHEAEQVRRDAKANTEVTTRGQGEQLFPPPEKGIDGHG